ncbi:hypothetical protein TYRP_022764, partial [Tyrophagus putrescentiae]
MTPRSKVEASKSSASANNSKDAESENKNKKGSKDSKNSFSDPFNDAAIRRAFISKVFTIFATMLSVTFGILLFFTFNKQAQDFVGRHFLPLFFISLAVFLITLLPLCCCPAIARKVPLNYILLGVFTLSTSLAMAPLSIEYDLDILLIAVFATMVVVFAVALFSAYTSFDFTKCAIVAMVALGAFFLLAITSAIVWHFTRQPKWWNLAYGAIGVVLFVIYLAADIQKILGGRAVQLSPEDYVVATVYIYVDTLNIFVHLLIMSSKSSGK